MTRPVVLPIGSSDKKWEAKLAASRWGLNSPSMSKDFQTTVPLQELADSEGWLHGIKLSLSASLFTKFALLGPTPKCPGIFQSRIGN